MIMANEWKNKVGVSNKASTEWKWRMGVSNKVKVFLIKWPECIPISSMC